jgi:hypothetical protein
VTLGEWVSFGPAQVVLLGPTGPKDVDGGVGVGVGDMAARLALEYGAAPVAS